MRSTESIPKFISLFRKLMFYKFRKASSENFLKQIIQKYIIYKRSFKIMRVEFEFMWVQEEKIFYYGQWIRCNIPINIV